MKMKIVSTIGSIFIIIALLLSYYLYTGRSCGVSSKICIESRKISVGTSVERIGKNGKVIFNIGLIDNTRTYDIDMQLRDEWNFGDENSTTQLSEEVHTGRMMPDYLIASYTKEYTYTKPGTYTVLLKIIDATHHTTYTAEPLSVTIPESAFK
ncbi:MAG: hypothetical protein HYV32_06420 [Candidatus Kerfeldbacteria bacterium]|nr:hypothetical protein [Candidatus Kerfeldbacteria bacterium]